MSSKENLERENMIRRAAGQPELRVHRDAIDLAPEGRSALGHLDACSCQHDAPREDKVDFPLDGKTPAKYLRLADHLVAHMATDEWPGERDQLRAALDHVSPMHEVNWRHAPIQLVRRSLVQRLHRHAAILAEMQRKVGSK